MSANETFIPSTIVDSAYATYEVGKARVKIEGEGEHAREKQKGFISMGLGGGGLAHKSKAEFISSHFFLSLWALSLGTHWRTGAYGHRLQK